MTGPVLIVEDEPDCLLMFEVLLRRSGYETVTASNGREALARARETNPRLILLDLMMPVMDGIQFRLAQAADPQIAGIPVVIASAHHHAGEIARRLGAAGVFLKTSDPDELLQLVAAHARP